MDRRMGASRDWKLDKYLCGMDLQLLQCTRKGGVCQFVVFRRATKIVVIGLIVAPRRTRRESQHESSTRRWKRVVSGARDGRWLMVSPSTCKLEQSMDGSQNGQWVSPMLQ